ncbi:MAG TPA: SDR family NAD(P)-dependent oxidoreductase [Gaiellaceae bacterium]|jgi:NADP-dependent 3-hydroxy acid dehydrogenase YdfG|nr:SDR family NAD(P)-dependent oxidoreductase [Gaiellaceae bacterium]
MAALEGKRAIVTGASSGIGAATARELEEAGARVYTGSRRDGNLDVTDPESSKRFVEAALAELGGLDILFNNAGLSRGRDPVWDSLEEDEREVIETNVLGLMRMTRLCLPYLIADGGGHIVNMGSVAGIWAYPSGSSYVASKFAVHGYTRALRDDLQGKPVRVTNVAAGIVETDFSKVRFKGDEEKARAVYANVAMGGPLNAQDIAECVLFALTRRPNVNIDEILVMALAQVSGGNILRD